MLSPHTGCRPCSIASLAALRVAPWPVLVLRKAPTLCLERWSLAVCLGDMMDLPLSGCTVLVQKQAQGPGEVASSRYQESRHGESRRETGRLTATPHTPDHHGGTGARTHRSARGGGASHCLFSTESHSCGSPVRLLTRGRRAAAAGICGRMKEKTAQGASFRGLPVTFAPLAVAVGARAPCLQQDESPPAKAE